MIQDVSQYTRVSWPPFVFSFKRCLLRFRCAKLQPLLYLAALASLQAAVLSAALSPRNELPPMTTQV